MAKSKIDQLDPFKEETEPEYRTKDIKHSFARTARDLIINVLSIGKKTPHLLLLITGAIAIAVIIVVGLTTMSSQTPTSGGESSSTSPASQNQGSGSSDGKTPVTPSGQDDDNPNDPEATEAEQEKLSTVLSLVSAEDWEYAGALVETISPKYLNDCDKLHYYRSIVSISDHFSGLSTSKETAAMHVSQLENACVVTNE